MSDPVHEGWKPRTLPGFMGLVGPLWTKRQGASWNYGIVAEERHTNPAGIVHGGMLTHAAGPRVEHHRLGSQRAQARA